MTATPADLEAAWFAGYQAARSRIIAGIQQDRGGPEPDSFRHLNDVYRNAVNSEAQDEARTQHESTATMQAMLADACAQLAEAQAEIERLTEAAS